MTIKLLMAGLALAFAGCLLSGCSSSWRHINMSATECIRTAKLAMRDSYFTQNLRVISADGATVVLGEHAGYKGRVICEPGKRIVEVVGLDPDEVIFYKKSIIKRF